MKIQIEDRMSESEINSLFTVNGRQIRTKAPKRGRGFKKAIQHEDYLAEGVSIHPPGSKQRLADLKAFYDLAVKFEEPPSPFNC